jgi:hypothetical protein
MNPIFQLQRDITRYEADAIYYQYRAEHCCREAALLRRNKKNRPAREPRSKMRESAPSIILGLDGLTGAEIEAAEKVLSGDSVQKVAIQRLREIASNHSILETS